MVALYAKQTCQHLSSTPLLCNEVNAIQGCQTEQSLHGTIAVLIVLQHCSGCPTESATKLSQLLDTYELCVSSDAMPLYHCMHHNAPRQYSYKQH